jgi:hypothetical protein
MVAVAGEDKDVHALGGCDDFALDTPAPRLQPGWPPQSCSRLCEQLVRGLLGDRAQRLGRRVGRWVAAQQAMAGRSGDGFRLGVRDVQQRHSGVCRQEGDRFGDGGLPGVFDDPDERAQATSGLQAQP